MSKAVVGVIKCGDYSGQRVADCLVRCFELLGGLCRFVKTGDTVLVKPNLIAPKSHRRAVQTDPVVILEMARLLKDFGARPFVADSPAWGNTFGCIRALKLQEPLKKLGVPIKQLNKPLVCKVGANNTKVGISSVALDADVIINIPKFKAHQQLLATFAVKNMFGCVTGKKKAIWHLVKGKRREDFCEFLIDVYKLMNPVVTIIDGVITMDGPGPISGRARPLGYLIGGTEPIACETVCCKLVGIEPGELPMIRAARRMGFGVSEFDNIEVVGDGVPKEPCGDFELPELVSVRFSVLHVIKSVCKQVLILSRAAIKKISSGG